MIDTEEFIKRARAVHGDRYDYSKTMYIGIASKLVIICPVHGMFKTQARNHLAGCKCGKCGRSRIDPAYKAKAQALLDSID